MKGILHFFSLCWNRRRLYIVFLFVNQIIKIAISFVMLFFPKIILDTVFVYSDFQKSILCIIFFSFLILLLN